jgi:hypothetical protein
MIKIIIAILFRPSAQCSIAFTIGILRAIMLTITEMSKAIVGSEIKINKGLIDSDLNRKLPAVPIIIKNTGSKADKKLLVPDGKSFSSSGTYSIRSEKVKLFFKIILGKNIPLAIAIGKVNIKP